MTGNGVKTSEVDGSVYTGSFDHGKVCICNNTFSLDVDLLYMNLASGTWKACVETPHVRWNVFE